MSSEQRDSVSITAALIWGTSSRPDRVLECSDSSVMAAFDASVRHSSPGDMAWEVGRGRYVLVCEFVEQGPGDTRDSVAWLLVGPLSRDEVENVQPHAQQLARALQACPGRLVSARSVDGIPRSARSADGWSLQRPKGLVHGLTYSAMPRDPSRHVHGGDAAPAKPLAPPASNLRWMPLVAGGAMIASVTLTLHATWQRNRIAEELDRVNALYNDLQRRLVALSDGESALRSEVEQLKEANQVLLRENSEIRNRDRSDHEGTRGDSR